MLSNIEPKKIVQIIYRDTSGCSHYRLRYNAAYFGAKEEFNLVPVLVPFPSFDGNWLNNTKAFVCQRLVSPQDLEMVKALKANQPKFGYKMIWEVDDQCFAINGEGIPEYNMASFNFNKTMKQLNETLKQILPMFDEIVVSTEFLGKAIRKEFGVDNIRVIRNVVPEYLWSKGEKAPITEDLVKPKIGFTGAPQHYRQPIPIGVSPEFPLGVSPLKGDWSDGWIEFIKDNVKNDKIDFTSHASQIWFLDEVKDKIHFAPWVDCLNYPGFVQRNNYDIIIAPLAENTFNKCKSDLRFIEAAIAGSVILGTDFVDSPYEMIHPLCKCKPNITKEELDKKLEQICKKEVYNEILKYQYDYIRKNGRILESRFHVDQWLSMID